MPSQLLQDPLVLALLDWVCHAQLHWDPLGPCELSGGLPCPFESRLERPCSCASTSLHSSSSSELPLADGVKALSLQVQTCCPSFILKSATLLLWPTVRLNLAPATYTYAEPFTAPSVALLVA